MDRNNTPQQISIFQNTDPDNILNETIASQPANVVEIVELPCFVANMDSALRFVGFSNSELSSGGLGLQFRLGGMIHQRPIESNCKETNSIVFRMRRKCRRKISSNLHSEVEVISEKAEILGIASRAYNFDRPHDCLFLPSDSFLSVPDTADQSQSHAQSQPASSTSLNIVSDNPVLELMPGPFMHMSSSSKRRSVFNMLGKKEKLLELHLPKKKSLSRAYNLKSINFGDPIPLNPVRGKLPFKRQRKSRSVMVFIIKKLFELFPSWSRDLVHLCPEFQVAEREYASSILRNWEQNASIFGYFIKHSRSSFQYTWFKYGIDPYVDSRSRIYQKVFPKLSSALVRAAQSRLKIFLGRIASSVTVDLDLLELRPQSSTSTDSRDRINISFCFKNLPEKPAWFACELNHLHDDSVIERISSCNLLKTPKATTGWFAASDHAWLTTFCESYLIDRVKAFTSIDAAAHIAQYEEARILHGVSDTSDYWVRRRWDCMVLWRRKFIAAVGGMTPMGAHECAPSDGNLDTHDAVETYGASDSSRLDAFMDADGDHDSSTQQEEIDMDALAVTNEANSTQTTNDSQLQASKLLTAHLDAAVNHHATKSGANDNLIDFSSLLMGDSSIEAFDVFGDYIDDSGQDEDEDEDEVDGEDEVEDDDFEDENDNDDEDDEIEEVEDFDEDDEDYDFVK